MDIFWFSVDYSTIDVSHIVDIHKYLTKKHIIFKFMWQPFIAF